MHPDAGSNGLCGLGVAALKFLLSVVAHGLEILVLQSQSFRFPHLLPFTCGGGYGPEGFLAEAEAPFPWVVNGSGDTRALEERGGFAGLGENVGGSVPDISMGTVASLRFGGPPGSISMSKTPFTALGSESAWISLGALCALFCSSILFLQMSEQWGSLLDPW